jgi:hypothetical protein
LPCCLHGPAAVWWRGQLLRWRRAVHHPRRDVLHTRGEPCDAAHWHGGLHRGLVLYRRPPLPVQLGSVRERREPHRQRLQWAVHRRVLLSRHGQHGAHRPAVWQRHGVLQRGRVVAHAGVHRVLLAGRRQRQRPNSAAAVRGGQHVRGRREDAVPWWHLFIGVGCDVVQRGVHRGVLLPRWLHVGHRSVVRRGGSVLPCRGVGAPCCGARQLLHTHLRECAASHRVGGVPPGLLLHKWRPDGVSCGALRGGHRRDQLGELRLLPCSACGPVCLRVRVELKCCCCCCCCCVVVMVGVAVVRRAVRGGVLLPRQLHHGNICALWQQRRVLPCRLWCASGRDRGLLHHRRHLHNTDGADRVLTRHVLRGWGVDGLPGGAVGQPWRGRHHHLPQRVRCRVPVPCAVHGADHVRGR